MDRDKLEPIITAALAELYEREQDVILGDVNERTICSSLADILRPHFPDHRVHAEYNRRGKGVEPKEIAWPDNEGNPTYKNVFPDIIVHQPGHDLANLLVIEVKKTTNPYHDEGDLAKLDKLCWQVGYRHGLFLRLPAGKGAAVDGIVKVWRDGPQPQPR